MENEPVALPSMLGDVDFTFDEINSARNGFVESIGEDVDLTIRKLEILEADVATNSPNCFYTDVRRGLVVGLRRLISGEKMREDIGLAAGASFLCFFMKVWGLAQSKRQFEALRRIWDYRNVIGGDQNLLDHLFEFAVGIIYSRHSHVIEYHDLGQSDGKHDWLLNPGCANSVRVEAKAARWISGSVFSPQVHRAIQDLLKASIAAVGQQGLEGFLLLEFAKDEPALKQAEATDSALEDLSELLGTVPRDGKHSVGRWTSRLQPKPPGYSQYARRQIEAGNFDMRGCADIVFLEDGPVCGLRFRWDHDRPVINQMNKALDQVSGSEYKAVWIQISGMGTRLENMKSDFMNLLNTKTFDDAFESSIAAPNNSKFCSLHLALDFMFSFKSESTLGLLLPNIIVSREPADQARSDAMRENRRWYSRNILDRDPDADERRAFHDPKVVKALINQMERRLAHRTANPAKHTKGRA